MTVLKKDLEKLKKDILSLCAVVEESVSKAMIAVDKRDSRLATDVIRSDSIIDEMEVNLEEDCLKTLALYQPVAADLRFIIAVLKINNDLERIGDLSVNIAQRAQYLAEHKSVSQPEVLSPMADKARLMLRWSLDAFVNDDAELARRVLVIDDEVDDLHRQMFGTFQDTTRREPDNVDGFLQYLTVSRNLERIADGATNIAEDVVYLIEGNIVRHQHKG